MSQVEQADKRKKLDWALDYAEQGFYVLPCHYVLKDGQCSCRSKKCGRIGKHPTTRNGVLNATKDPEQIRRWWGAMPHANIGIATGRELPDGGILIVVDVDTDAGKGKQGGASLKQLIDDNGELPETLRQRTGSGGTHYFFRTSKPYKSDNNGRIGKDIDCRCHSGYIVAPPSNHYSGGRYEWLNELPIAEMPEWIGANLLVDGEERPKKGKVDASADAGEKFTEDDLKGRKLTKEDAAKLLKVIPSDARDTWWKCGAALKTEFGEDGKPIWDEWSKGSDKYDEQIQDVQWRSFKPGELTGGTIVHFARENGWRGFDTEAADDPTLRERWIYVVGIKRFVNLGTMEELDGEQFSASFAPMFRSGKAADHVLRNEEFPRVDGVTYWPNQPRIVKEQSPHGKDHVLTKLNMWSPSGLTPETGSVEPFLRHIAYLFPDEREQGIVLDYMAFQIQHPGKKVHWALLITGTQGNGKSYLGSVFKWVLGKHNVRSIHSDLLHETFTGWQKATQLVVVEELMARGRQEIMNKLKPMITEPWSSIREMYKPPYEQPNRFNFLLLSNHNDAIIIDDTDRRYCVLRSPAPPHPDGIKGYYEPLFTWSEQNAGRLLYFFLQRDLNQFVPQAHAPMTEAKRQLIAESMPALDQWVMQQVELMQWPFNVDLVSPGEIAGQLHEFGLRANPKEVGRALARLEYKFLGTSRLSRDTDSSGKPKPIPVYAVRNIKDYAAMTPDQIRQVWSQQPVLEQRERADDPADGEVIKAHRRQNVVKETKPM